MLRFVTPETCTLPLSDGETLTVRKRLTHGQRAACYARMYRTVVDDKGEGKLAFDPLRTGDATTIAYLVDWTAKGPDGAVVPIRGISADELQDVLNALDEDSYREIKVAIDIHETAMIREQAEQKKTRSGELALVGT